VDLSLYGVHGSGTVHLYIAPTVGDVPY